jgi:transposase
MAKKHPWHTCEIRISWRMYLEGKELSEIAAKLDRSIASIEYCLATWPNPFYKAA